QVAHFIKVIRDSGAAMDTDANLLGAAWVDYRQDPVVYTPAKYWAAFRTARGAIINDQMIDKVKREKITSAQHQAAALLLIMQKAARTVAIKAGAGQRSLDAARQHAADLVTQITNLYGNPDNYSPRPVNVTNGSKNLVTNAPKKDFYTSPDNLTLARGQWKTVEAGYKLFKTKAAAMEKVMATKIKAFHKIELEDVTVRARVHAAE